MTAAAAGAEQLEKPLSNLGWDLLGYTSAHTLEALLEALLGLEFLGKGYARIEAASNPAALQTVSRRLTSWRQPV